MEFLAEFWQFLNARRKLWMWPLFAIMVALGGMVVLAQGTAIAPFIYTLF